MIVWLHIGTPKSGTTYLQDLMGKNAENRRQLAADGVLWPGEDWRDQVRAVRDVLDFYPNGVVNPAIKGWWETVRGRIMAWDGRAAILSMEWLVHARPDQVQKIVESLAPHEVRVIITARDIARGVPAQWQEQVQNWAVWTYEEYLDGVTAEDPLQTQPGRQFWTDHDLGTIIRNWSAGVPVERMTMITVPGRGAPPDLLWERFAGVIGVDPAAYDTKVRPSNTSIGAASAELLRRVNVMTREAGLDWAYGDPVVKWTLGKRILGPRRRKEEGITLPTAYRGWADRESRRLITEVQGLGVPVVGSLEELMPEDSAFGEDGAPTAEQMLDAALDGVTGLVMNLAKRVETEMAAARTSTPTPVPTRVQRVLRSRPMKPVAVVAVPVRDALKRLRRTPAV